MKQCVFAGTFDPFTLGHADTVEKSLEIFDRVIVAVAENRNKQCRFSAEERYEMVRAVYADNAAVRVLKWDGTIVDLLVAEKTPFYVRGLRSAADYAYETADFYASRKFSKEMITLYLPSEQEHLHISSTFVRNCIAFGKSYREFVPEAVYQYIQKRGNHV